MKSAAAVAVALAVVALAHIAQAAPASDELKTLPGSLGGRERERERRGSEAD